MKCPYCQDPLILNRVHEWYLCMNKNCKHSATEDKQILIQIDDELKDYILPLPDYHRAQGYGYTNKAVVVTKLFLSNKVELPYIPIDVDNLQNTIDKILKMMKLIAFI